MNRNMRLHHPWMIVIVTCTAFATLATGCWGDALPSGTYDTTAPSSSNNAGTTTAGIGSGTTTPGASGTNGTGNPANGQPAGKVNLGIADRAWDPSAPAEGWCGETCIQEALAYYGRELSQRAINQAAGGGRPDIIETTMDRALDTLGVNYTTWDDSNSDETQFVAWIQDALRQGHPVICGMKIYPDETPEWYVDHFVLAVGFDQTGLLLNTQLDCDGQVTVSYGQLASQHDGYAFQSRYHRYFGRIITGLR